MADRHDQRPTMREAVAPAMSALLQMCAALDEMPERYGHLPSADSGAMRDLVADEEYGTWTPWDRPLRDTHSFGGVTLFAATDYARCFAQSFEPDAVPVFGHLVLARAAMEASSGAIWLNDPMLDPFHRIRRGFIHRIHSARELTKIPSLKEHGRELDARYSAMAQHFKWSVSNRRHPLTVGGEGRPSVPETMARVLVGSGEREIGKTLWAYLSGVAHSTWYGLAQAVLQPPSSPDGLARISLAGIGTDSGSVNTQAACVLRMLSAAGAARLTLFGWTSDEWIRARDHAEGLVPELIRAAVAARPDGVAG